MHVERGNILDYSPEQDLFEKIDSATLPSTSFQIGIHKVETHQKEVRYVLEIQRLGGSSFLPLYRHEAQVLYPKYFEDFIEAELDNGKEILTK